MQDGLLRMVQISRLQTKHMQSKNKRQTLIFLKGLDIMAILLINTATGERYTVLPYSINLNKVINLDTGTVMFWTCFDYEYAIESGHFEILEEA